jgi:glycosyltransferase involved in cell wall biosynthesis
MQILVNGEIGGSGGYVGYCKGLFGSGVWPAEFNTIFCCSTEFAAKLGHLDTDIKVVPHPWPASRHRCLRYLWHLWVYPRLARQYQPDIEFYPSGNLRDLMRHPQSVTVCHNLLPFDETEINRYTGERRDSWLRHRKRQGHMFERSSGVIFLSEHSRQVVTRQFPRIRNTRVIAHGIDDTFRRTTPRCYELANRIQILYVSPVYHYKHQCEVVQAVGILRMKTKLDIQLRLVGGGAEEDMQALRRTLDDCGGEQFCHLLPFLSGKAVLKEFTDADMFVFASTCETFGITLVEAMGSRLPIACSNQSGLSKILRNAGVYFDPANIESIVDALRQLITDATLRQACGEQAYRYSLDYTWERCASETVAFLKQIAGK